MIAFSFAEVKCSTTLKLLVLLEHREISSKRGKQKDDFETNARNRLTNICENLFELKGTQINILKFACQS